MNDGVSLRSSAGGAEQTLLAPSPIDFDRVFSIPDPSAPVWDAQGDKVAVSEPTLSDTLNGQDCQIWIVPTSGRGAHPLDASGTHPLRCHPPTSLGQSLSWNPAGTTLAFATDQGLWTVSTAGGPPRLMRATPGLTLGSVAWSPDGSTILAEVVAGTGESAYSQNGGIDSFPVDGGAPSVLIPAASARVSLYAPGLVWAPGGGHFAFVSVSPGSDPSYPAYRIATASADGTGLQTVARPGYDNPFALTGWTAAAGGKTLGPGTSPTTASSPPPTPAPTTTVPVQPPAAGPVPAVTGLSDLSKPPTVAPGQGSPPTSLVGRDLIVGHGPAVTLTSTVSDRSEEVNFSTGHSDYTLAPVAWNQPSPPFQINNSAPGFRNALIGMRAGGVREVVIPPKLGFGSETIVLVVELVSTT